MPSVPALISVDDHVIEPRDLWTSRLPPSLRDRAPHVEKTMAVAGGWEFGGWKFIEDPDHPDAKPADVWIYEDSRVMLQRGFASAGLERGELDDNPLSYDNDMRPGCYQQGPRLMDMDQNHTEASLCFPSVSRFCGQFFMDRKDPTLALECVKTYNDWMIDEWCGGDARGRLIPVTLIPLWDVELAAAEVQRCADKGSHAIAFSEAPHALGLPSMHSGQWDRLWAVCDDTDTVINMHIGSSSRRPVTSEDAPHIVTSALLWEYGMKGLIDWIFSGTLERFPTLHVAFSEAQAGWMPYVLERMDKLWERNEAVDNIRDQVPNRPSTYVSGRIFSCIFDDLVALKNRDAIGMSQIMFESDYPHADSTWDYTAETAEKLCDAAGLDDHERWQLMRGNAISCFRLDRYFGISD